MIIRPVRTLTLPEPVNYAQRAFLSFVAAPGGFWHCAYREFTPERSDKETHVRYQRYTAGWEPVGPSSLIWSGGEDPRAFMWRNRPMALFHSWDEEKKDHKVWLADLETFGVCEIRHDLEFAGKNWMPAPDEEALYLIRSLDPLCILGFGPWGHESAVIESYRNPDLGRHIGQLRGGCAARVVGRKIVGVGHKTIDTPLSHTPYGFTFDLDSRDLTVEEMTVEGDYPLIDPTSLIEWPGPGGLMVVSAAREHWWAPQDIASILCSVTAT